MTTTASKPLRIPTLSSSDLRQVHNLGGPLGAALAADDRWRAAVEALNALHAAGRTLADAGDPVDQLADQLTEAAGSGEPLGDVLELAAAHVASADSVKVARLALQRAQVQMETELDYAAKAAFPSLFTALADDLADVLGAVAAVKSPRQLATADGAIGAGRADDWQTWRELLDRHEQIRAQQGKLMRLTGVTTSFSEAAFIRRADRLMPEWAAFHRDGRVLDPDSPHRGEPIAPPWPTDRDGRVPAAGAGSEVFLMWALDAKAELWLPTPDQLKAETARLTGLLASTTVDGSPVTAAGRARETARVRASRPR